ncbi:MAG: hypothetical protein H6577_04085 [Lewinellaceae bacterium]|nr:hypothetical protein [Saprospiraceae bacterium]MCB9337284.1 hypothetical protein [Lewinellaceae bacterium]
MKAFPFYSAFAILLATFSLTSCLKDKCEREVTYTRFDPVYKTLEEVHTGTAVKEAPRPLKAPGQIYYYNNHMFVVEKHEGIHVIDNSDPSNPQNTAFIKIPGNQDIAIKDGLLYANTYIDLLVIDLTGDQFPVVGRAENVFNPYYQDLTGGQIIVEYVETQVTETLSCDEQQYLYEWNGGLFRGGADFEGDVLAVAENSFDASSGAAPGVGIAGSLAHFSIIGDYLYTIQHDGYFLEIYDLTQPASPVHAKTVEVGVHLETLFPYGDKLFIGSNTGMYIYDNSDPLNPTQLSLFEHARGCDPVFVYGNYAYVTLWDGSTCGGGPNQLDVIDISNLTNPVLKKSFSMQNPHGLSVKGNTLLLCEGDYGLKSFDNTDPVTVGDHLLDQVKNVQAIDVISLPGSANVAMVIGEGGFYQYSFDNPSDMQFLSLIPVEK